MRRRAMIALLAVLSLASASDVARAQETTGMTLRVSVKNNTADGTPVAGDEAVLELYRNAELFGSLRAEVSATAEAVFEDVPTGPRMIGVARVKHQNMVFKSRPIPLNRAAEEPFVAVQVFDVSSDRSELSVRTHHVMIALRATSLQFEEYVLLENRSDRAIREAERDEADKPIVIEFPLPRGFRDLTASGYLERQALVVTSEGFYDTLAVPPGQHDISFSYKVDIERPTIEVTRGISVPTAELTIFWEHGGGQLDGLGPPDGRLVNADGVPIEYYQRNDLSPGDTISFRVSGFNVQQSDKRTWIILAGVLGAALALALLRARSKAAPKPREQ